MGLPVDLRLRPPDLTDLGGLVALVDAAVASYAAWTAPGWTPPALVDEHARWAARIRQPGRWTRVAATAAAGVAAVAGLVSWAPALDAEDEPVAGVAQIDALFVAPERWRSGIASALLADAEAAIGSSGYARGELWTPLGAPAERFYRHAGWRRDGRLEWHPPLSLTVVGYHKRVA